MQAKTMLSNGQALVAELEIRALTANYFSAIGGTADFFASNRFGSSDF